MGREGLWRLTWRVPAGSGGSGAGQVKLVTAWPFYAKREHLYQIESPKLMMTSAQWIPLDRACKKDVVDKLLAEPRTFIKQIRCEARRTAEFPNSQSLDAALDQYRSTY